MSLFRRTPKQSDMIPCPRCTALVTRRLECPVCQLDLREAVPQAAEPPRST